MQRLLTGVGHVETVSWWSERFCISDMIAAV